MPWKELTVEDWKDELSSALEYRRLYGVEDRWAEMEALFYNTHGSQKESAGPNIIVSTGDALLSGLSVPTPYVTVKPRRSEFMQKARVVESIDNMLIDDMNMPDAVEQAVTSTFIWGRGLLKMGYDSEFGYDPRFDMGGQEPIGMTPSQFDERGLRIEFNRVRPGMPWIKGVLPHDFLVPWGTFDIDDAAWCAHRVIRHVDDIKSDMKYVNTRNLEPELSRMDFVKSYQTVNKFYRMGRAEHWAGERGSGDVEYCELWEIHDRRTSKIYVVSMGHDKFLRNETDYLQAEGLPFVGVSFVPRARNFWVTPDAMYLRTHQAELNDIAVQRMAHRRISLTKWIASSDAFEEAELSKLLGPIPGAVAKTKPGIDIEKSIKTLTPGYNQALPMEEQQVRMAAREAVGMSANQSGQYQGGRKTAREVEAVENSSDLRMSRRQGGLSKLYTKTFRVINSILFEHWKLPRVAEVIGEQGTQEWVKYTGKGIAGQYLYRVGFSTGGAETLQQRRQQALQYYMMMAQDPTIDPIKMRQFLAASVNDPEFSSIFKEGVLNGQIGQQTQGGGGVQMGGGQGGTQTAGQGGQQQLAGPPQGLLPG